MKTATVDPSGHIVLPEEIRQRLQNVERLLILEDNDVIMLKPIRMPDVLDMPAQHPEEAPSLEEIAQEVHQYRREQGKTP